MEWRDDGIVIGVRKHGETGVILDLLTRDHGRHLGLVHGGRSRRLRPCLQTGNTVEASWRARIEDALGTFAIEPRVLRAARVIDSAVALHAVNHLCMLVRLLPEREPNADLHDRLTTIFDHLDDRTTTPALVVLFEMALLTQLGFGLDLARCAATGSQDELIYVSPRSGRAVSKGAGAPFRERMLTLPAFLREDSAAASPRDVAAGFRLIEHFLMRDVFTPRSLAFSEARNAYIRAIAADG